MDRDAVGRAWATDYRVFALPIAAGVLAPIGIVLAPAVGARTA